MFWSMRTSNAQSPRFALSLSFEGIGLEEYAKGASSKIAEAILDMDDFDQRMSELSRKAEAMSGDGLRVALILPNEQIKFVSVACPDDADPITINEHILRTMDGATPYPMDELRFDHHLADGTLYVAAVALETLNEAEEFAKNYGFSPLACIARTDTFPTEVFFGLSDAPLGLMPRLSTEEPEDDVEESAPPVIAFARRDTPEDTIIIASTAPLPVEARLSLTPEPVSPTAKPIAATNDAIIAKQSELGAKIAARIAENNAGQSWRAPALLLLLIALIGGATWAYLRQEPNIAQPEIELLAPEVQQTAGTPDPTPAAPSPTPETEDVPRVPVTAMAPPSPDVISPVETESAILDPEGEAELEFADQGPAASSNYADLVLPFLTDPEMIPKDALERIYIASGVWALEPVAPTVPDQVTLGDLYVASIDPGFEQQDAIALGSIQNPFADQIFLSPPSPAPEGTVFVLDDRGLVTPSSEGTLSPDGHRVFAGLPNFRLPERPNLIEEPAPVAIRLTNTGLPINELKPRLPPTAEEEPVIFSAAAGIRPRLRPNDLATPAAIAEAIASAQASARTSSMMPRLRPKDLKIPVQTALTPTTRNRPSDETVTRQNSSSFVAAEATLEDAINLRKINVIGIYGSGSKRRALVRMTTGRRVMVEVGDRLDGGRVAAISDSELRYVKGGRNVVLKIPKG
jgi:type IV pilus biogenesis protein PilP